MGAMAGKVIVVTRPRPECDETAAWIGRAGGVALCSPVLEIAPPADVAPLREALGRLHSYRGVILTSVNGARALVESLPRERVAWPPLYAVGPKTAAYLRERGFNPVVPERPADGLAMAELLPDGAGLPYLFLRAEEGREELVACLTAAGCQVSLVTAYRSVAAAGLSAAVVTAWRQQWVDAVTFFSARTAQVFLELLARAGGEGYPWPLVAVNSRQTAAPLLARGIDVAVVSEKPTAESLLAALLAHLAEQIPCK